MASLLPRLFAFTNTHTLSSGQAIQGDVYFSPDTGLITPNYTRSRPEISEHVTRIDLNGEYVVAPGYLEVQTNGLVGVHFTALGKRDDDDDEAKLQRVARELVKHGVTGFLATVPTVDKHRWQQILPRLRPRSFPNGATLLGAHVEGPYLNPAKQGAHDSRFFQLPESTPYKTLYGDKNLQSVIKLITLAPELPGSTGMITSIRQTYPEIVVSLGHSAATYEQGQEALAAGARGLTHVYNAMGPLNHREPGLAGLIADNVASDVPQESMSSPSEHLLSSNVSVTDWLARQMAVIDPKFGNNGQSASTGETTTATMVTSNRRRQEVFFSLIPDMIHVHRSSLTMAHRTAPHKSILITDSIELSGLSDGEYPANDQITTPQTKVGNRVTKSGTDILIGSCITLDECVRNMVDHCGCSLAEAVRCVTENVARYLGGVARGRGRLDIGCRADFVILDRNGNVQQTWIEGVKVWDSSDR